MKKLCLLICTLLPVSLMAQTTFNIVGKVKKLKNGDKIYMLHEANSLFKMDSTNVKNGTFHFTGTTLNPAQAFLYLNKKPAMTRTPKIENIDMFRFYLEAVNITLSATDSLKNIKVTGSPVNKDYEAWKTVSKPAEDSLIAFWKKVGGLTDLQMNNDTIRQKMMAQEKQYQRNLSMLGLQFAQTHPTSYLSLLILEQASADTTTREIATHAYANLAPLLKSTEKGKGILALLSSPARTRIGVIAADFEQCTPEGKTIKLSDYKGKYILVDFWASWCGPCRAENPNVLDAYHKYKDKGFTVLGVSLDYPGKKDTWVKAIAEDKLDWTQVSELKGWDNIAALQYGVRSIPSNFLIDPSGKIIAKNLRGDDLNNKLSELFNTPAK